MTSVIALQNVTVVGGCVVHEDGVMSSREIVRMISKDDVHSLAIVLENKYAIDRIISGQSLLQMSASYGAEKCIRELLRRGARVEEPDDVGMTPLHAVCASRQGDVEGSIQALIEAGAACNPKDALGRTPLDYAISAGDPLLAQVIISVGGLPSRPAEGWIARFLEGKTIDSVSRY